MRTKLARQVELEARQVELEAAALVLFSFLWFTFFVLVVYLAYNHYGAVPQ